MNSSISRIALLAVVLAALTGAGGKGSAKPKTPPKVTITIDGNSDLEMSTAHQNESGPESCVKGLDEKTHEAAGIWKGNWKGLKPKAGSSFSPGAGATFQGNLESKGHVDLDLKQCKGEYNGVRFLGHENCKPGQFCPKDTGCGGIFSQSSGYGSSVKVSATGKSYLAEIRADYGANSTCYEGMEIFNHWFYANPSPVPSLHTFRVKLTPDETAKKQTLKVLRKGRFDCATPTVKAIAGGTYYGCLLFYNVTGTVTVNGPYRAKLLKVSPWDDK